MTLTPLQQSILAIIDFYKSECTAQKLLDQLAGNNKQTRGSILTACYKLRANKELIWNGAVIEPWTHLMRYQGP